MFRIFLSLIKGILWESVGIGSELAHFVLACGAVRGYGHAFKLVWLTLRRTCHCHYSFRVYTWQRLRCTVMLLGKMNDVNF